jgi:hypothetical protein
MNREAYSLTAGLALGLVGLARGSSAPGLADLHIEDRLHRSVHFFYFSFLFSLNAPLPLPVPVIRVHACDGPRRYIYGGREEQNGAYIGYGASEVGANGSRVKSSLVLEPGPVNVDITSPGATLALGAPF